MKLAGKSMFVLAVAALVTATNAYLDGASPLSGGLNDEMNTKANVRSL